MEILRGWDPMRAVSGVRTQPPARQWSGLVVALGAATVALLLLIGPGAAASAGASGLLIGTGSTVQLGNALFNLGCNDLQIAPAGTLDAQASTIEVAGNWDNRGTFDPGTETVRVEDGCAMPETSVIGGSNTFFDLLVMTSTGKTVRFQAGATQTILDHLTLMGAPGNLLKIRSTMVGEQAFLNLAQMGSQQIDHVDVADNGATGRLLAPGSPALHQSINSGNTTGWFFTGAGAAPVASGIGVLGLIVVLFVVAGMTLRRSHGRADTFTAVSE